MPRTPTSKKSTCWTVLSFLSSGLSDRPTATTTAATTTPTTPTTIAAAAAAAAAAATTTTGRKETQRSDSENKKIPTSGEEGADPSWIMLHDSDSEPFWLNKNTGLWTYDGKTVYGPPAPVTATSAGHNPLWSHQQQQPLPPKHVLYAQPAVGYYAPGPYAATQHYLW